MTQGDPIETEGAAFESSFEANATEASLRSLVWATFAEATLALMATPRYRSHTIAELEALVLGPTLRGRVAKARSSRPSEGPLEPPFEGMAFWAKVSPEVDANIRAQIKAGAFPVALKGEEWNSGEIVWLLDVIAPSREQTTALVKNFGQVAKGKVFVHPGLQALVTPPERVAAS